MLVLSEWRFYRRARPAIEGLVSRRSLGFSHVFYDPREYHQVRREKRARDTGARTLQRCRNSARHCNRKYRGHQEALLSGQIQVQASSPSCSHYLPAHVHPASLLLLFSQERALLPVYLFKQFCLRGIQPHGFLRCHRLQLPALLCRCNGDPESFYRFYISRDLVLLYASQEAFYFVGLDYRLELHYRACIFLSSRIPAEGFVSHHPFLLCFSSAVPLDILHYFIQPAYEEAHRIPAHFLRNALPRRDCDL